MIAEGKVMCPWCGQGEVIQFKMSTVKYNSSTYADSRTLHVTVENNTASTPHNCPSDTPGRKGSDNGW